MAEVANWPTSDMELERIVYATADYLNLREQSPKWAQAFWGVVVRAHMEVGYSPQVFEALSFEADEIIRGLREQTGVNE